MDPNEVLKAIVLLAQQIGQPCDKGTLIQNLEDLEQTARDLLIWVENGGFKPELTFFVEWDDETLDRITRDIDNETD